MEVVVAPEPDPPPPAAQLGLRCVGGASQVLPILLGLQTGASWRFWEHHSWRDLGLYPEGEAGPQEGMGHV